MFFSIGMETIFNISWHSWESIFFVAPKLWMQSNPGMMLKLWREYVLNSLPPSEFSLGKIKCLENIYLLKNNILYKV